MSGKHRKTAGHSKTWTYFEGEWHGGNVPIMGPRTHAAWLCSVVFDGARAFEGVAPDLDLHCARVNASAASLLLKPTVTLDTWMGLVADGLARFDRSAELYIRPMYWAEEGAPGGIRHTRTTINTARDETPRATRERAGTRWNR